MSSDRMASSRQAREFLIYWVALALVVAMLGAIVLLLRSRYGLALTAIRANELRSDGVEPAGAGVPDLLGRAGACRGDARRHRAAVALALWPGTDRHPRQ